MIRALTSLRSPLFRAGTATSPQLTKLRPNIEYHAERFDERWHGMIQPIFLDEVRGVSLQTIPFACTALWQTKSRVVKLPRGLELVSDPVAGRGAYSLVPVGESSVKFRHYKQALLEFEDQFCRVENAPPMTPEPQPIDFKGVDLKEPKPDLSHLHYEYGHPNTRERCPHRGGPVYAARTAMWWRIHDWRNGLIKLSDEEDENDIPMIEEFLERLRGSHYSMLPTEKELVEVPMTVRYPPYHPGYEEGLADGTSVVIRPQITYGGRPHTKSIAKIHEYKSQKDDRRNVYRLVRPRWYPFLMQGIVVPDNAPHLTVSAMRGENEFFKKECEERQRLIDTGGEDENDDGNVDFELGYYGYDVGRWREDVHNLLKETPISPIDTHEC